MAARTIEFFRSHDVIVMLSSISAPSVVEWNAYTTAIGELTTKRLLRGVLVVSEGGRPDARQRAQAAAAYGDYPVPLALCINSALARGVLTAMRWVYPGQIMGFGFDDVARGLAYLNVAEARRPDLCNRIREAQAGLGWRAIR